MFSNLKEIDQKCIFEEFNSFDELGPFYFEKVKQVRTILAFTRLYKEIEESKLGNDKKQKVLKQLNTLLLPALLKKLSSSKKRK